MREWNHYRTLVGEARENIAREMADNKREVTIVLNRIAERRKNLDTALQLANEVLATKKTSVPVAKE